MSKTSDNGAEPKEQPPYKHVESYGGGHVEGRHGRVNLWLVAVYAILFAWSIYYGLTHWGGLGPGLDY